MKLKGEDYDYAQYLILLVISFTVYLSNQMVVNTVTKFANTLTTSSQLIGFIGGMWGLASFFTRPFSGQVVDNEAHKKLLIVCMFGLVLSNLVLIGADSIPAILISRFLNGVAWGFGSTVCVTTACDSLPKERMIWGLGIYTMMQTLAQVIGPSIAIWIIETYSFRALFITTFLIMVIALVLSMFFKTKHQRRVVRKYSFSLKGMFAPKAFIPSSLLMCNTMEVSAIAGFILIYADSIGVTGLGLFFLVQALSIVVTRPFVSRFTTQKNQYYVTIFSECLIIIGLVNLFFSRSTAGFMFSAVLFGFGKSGAQPALTNMCVSSVSQDERGRASNTYYTFQDLGQIFGANIAGLLAGVLGYGGAFLSIAFIVAAFLLFFIFAYMIPHMREVTA